MNKDMRFKETLEIQKRELWIKVCYNVARAEDCKDKNIAPMYANAAVDAFEKRFTTNQVAETKEN